MNHEIIDDTDNGRFIIRRYGHINYERTVELLKEIISHPSWQKDLDLLVDLRQSNLSDFTMEDLEKISVLQATLKEKVGTGRLAFVAPETNSLKVDMYKFYADPKVEIKIQNFQFDDYYGALAWLNEEK